MRRQGDFFFSHHTKTNERFYIFQKRFSGFDPSMDKIAHIHKHGQIKSMKIPTWINLKQVPVEFMGVNHKIAAGIGEVLGADNSINPDESRFFLVLDVHLGWESSIIVTNKTTHVKSIIFIDYNFLPSDAAHIWIHPHYIRNCPSQ